MRCEQFGNFVFINEDREAAPLLESLGPIPQHLENLAFDSIRHIASSSFEIACNVKILLDAFLETYHLKSIHPQTVDRFLDSRGTHILLWPHGNSMMCTPHRRAEWRDPGAVGMPEVSDGRADLPEPESVVQLLSEPRSRHPRPQGRRSSRSGPRRRAA